MNNSATKEKTRLLSLDILRGFAVFGVLLVNAPSMNSPVIKDGNAFAFLFGEANKVYANIILHSAVGYFYPIFASLFGVAAAMVLTQNSRVIYLRRMSMLLFFGLCQGVFIWWGDVLAIYAVLGLGLTVLHDKSAGQIKNLLCVVSIIAIAISILSFVVGEGESLYPQINSLMVYQNGTFLEITRQRLLDYAWTYAPWLVSSIDMAQFIHTSVFIITLFFCFVAGFYVYKSGFLHKIILEKNLSRKVFLLTFISSLVMTLFVSLSTGAQDSLEIADSYLRGMCYASAILFICHYSFGLFLLKPLVWVGRMSLSNYLFHNLILSISLYGYGFGLYGKIGPYDQIPLVASLMIFSLVFSYGWLRSFKFGPLEWLWRMVTHGKIIPNRKKHYVDDKILTPAKDS